MKVWQESTDVSGAPVMMMTLTRCEVARDPRRVERKKKTYFDGEAPIFEHSVPLTQEVLYTQRLTGEMMLRKIERVMRDMDERGEEKPQELECQHDGAEDTGIAYLGLRLVLCEMCKGLIVAEMKKQMAPFVEGQKWPTASQMNVMMSAGGPQPPVAHANPGGHGQISVPVISPPRSRPPSDGD